MITCMRRVSNTGADKMALLGGLVGRDSGEKRGRGIKGLDDIWMVLCGRQFRARAFDRFDSIR